jgi:DNA-binding FadR family transcriptional regulator
VSKTKTPTAPIEREREPRGTGRRLHGAIAHKLGAAILAGEYLPGDVLSGEVVFSEQLDVSRSAYREAIQALAAKGLVESRPKAGTRVLPRNRWNLLDPEVLGWAFAGQPDMAFIRSLFELRAIVEPAAAALAAERRDKADLKSMRDALAGMTRHTLATEAGRVPDHRRVFAAIADSDPAAASEAMRVLVELALEDTRQSMQP